MDIIKTQTAKDYSVYEKADEISFKWGLFSFLMQLGRISLGDSSQSIHISFRHKILEHLFFEVLRMEGGNIFPY